MNERTKERKNERKNKREKERKKERKKDTFSELRHDFIGSLLKGTKKDKNYQTRELGNFPPPRFSPILLHFLSLFL